MHDCIICDNYKMCIDDSIFNGSDYKSLCEWLYIIYDNNFVDETCYSELRKYLEARKEFCNGEN